MAKLTARPIYMAIGLKTSFEVGKCIRPIYTGGSACLSADESILATCVDEDVEVTDISTGNRICQITGDGESLLCMAMSPDAHFLVTFSRSFYMKIYELLSGKLLRTTKAHDAPVIVARTEPTSTLVATGGAEGFVKVWDLEGGYVTHFFRGHSGVLSALEFHGVSKTERWRLASGSDDTKIMIWDLVKSKCLAVLEAHSSVIRGLSFSADGWTLVSGSRDQMVHVWDMKSFQLRNSFPVFETLETIGLVSVNRLTTNPEELLYTGGELGRVRWWNIESGKEESKLCTPHEESAIVDILYTESSMLVVHDDQTLILYRLEHGLPVIKRIAGHHDEVIDCLYVEDDKKLVIATNSNELRVLDLTKNTYFPLAGHTDIVIAIDRDRSGKWIASASKDNTAKLWRFVGDCWVDFATFIGHTESIGAVSLSKTESEYPKFLVTGSKDRTVKLWNVSGSIASESPHARFTRKAHEKDINCLDVSYDNLYFASASQDKTCKIWNAENGDVVGILRGHKRGVWSIAFNSHNNQVVTASSDKTVRLWSLGDFSCINCFEGHANSVLKALFLSTGPQVLSCGGDGLVKVWNIKDSECVATLDNHEEKVWALSVNSDESIIVTGGGDSRINFWKDRTEKEKAETQARKEKLVADEQILANHLLKKAWKEAIGLALSLDQPYRLLNIFKEVWRGSKGLSGVPEVDDALRSLSSEQLELLLQRIRDWNTNSRTALVAQRILYSLFNLYSSEALQQLKGARTLVPALYSYSNMQYQRVESMIQETYLIDYTAKTNST